MITTPGGRRIRLGVVSPYPPRSSPIAGYAYELRRALAVAAPEIATVVWAIGDGPARSRLPEVAGTITASDASAYRRVAHRVRARGVDVVLIQYGSGAAGGPHGRHLLGLCDELVRLAIPYLVTLHDARHSPRPDEANAIAALCRTAAGVIVLSDAARRAVVASRTVSEDAVAVVPLGAPPELYARAAPQSAELASALLEMGGRTVLSTVGILRPAKGIEVAIAALPELMRHRPGLCYIVAAPDSSEHSLLPGTWYRRALTRRAVDLGVADAVHLLVGSPTPADLAALLRCTAVYLAPDLDRGRTASTALACAVAAGAPVVATDHPYAREIISPARGALVPPADPVALAATVGALLDDSDRCAAARTAPRSASSLAAAGQIAGLLRLVTAPARRPTVVGREKAPASQPG